MPGFEGSGSPPEFDELCLPHLASKQSQSRSHQSLRGWHEFLGSLRGTCFLLFAGMVAEDLQNSIPMGICNKNK